MRRYVLLVAVFFAQGCKGKPQLSPENSTGPQRILAHVDDVTITAADMKDLLARFANQPYVLARYSSLEKKKELLDSIIRYQVLALEARKHGYERDPEVQRVAKDKMVRLFTQKEISDKVKTSDISDAEVEKFYREHTTDFMRPETVRVSQILVKDRARAQKVLAEVKALPKTDLKGFRDLVATHSEDADSKGRGGDLTQFDRTSTHHPSEVIASAFALEEVGDISDLVSTHKGFAILKLTERRPALSRTLADAKPEIQRQLLDELRAKKRKEFIEQARKDVKIEIDEAELAKLDITAALTAPTPASGVAGAAPGREIPSFDAGGVLGVHP